MSGGVTAQRLVWRNGLSFDGEDSWGHRLAISGDEAVDGMKPSDLLPLSLVACLSYDVVEVLRKKRPDLRDVEVPGSNPGSPTKKYLLRLAVRFWPASTTSFDHVWTRGANA